MRTSKVNSLFEIDIQQGTLLCATPINPDTDNFKTLVLVTRHSYLGATGVILNNPLGIKIHVNIEDNESKVLDLQYGGPMDEGLSFLVCLPSFHNGWRDSIYWSSNINDLKLLLSCIKTESFSISAYTGCIRWLPGELESQIKYKHWWPTEDYSVHEITGNSSDSWSSIARKTGGHFAPLVELESPIIFN